MSDTGKHRTDALIVGEGSAGAVLARRPSEHPTRSVLLLEAGRAYGVDGYTDDLRDPAHVPANPEHDWGHTTRGGAASPEIIAPRANVLGGCSAHNTTVATRARPSDLTVPAVAMLRAEGRSRHRSLIVSRRRGGVIVGEWLRSTALLAIAMRPS